MQSKTLILAPRRRHVAGGVFFLFEFRRMMMNTIYFYRQKVKGSVPKFFQVWQDSEFETWTGREVEIVDDCAYPDESNFAMYADMKRLRQFANDNKLTIDAFDYNYYRSLQHQATTRDEIEAELGLNRDADFVGEMFQGVVTE